MPVLSATPLSCTPLSCTPIAARAVGTEYTPPVSGGQWVNSGATAASYLFGPVLRVSNTAPFSISDRIRINEAEATIESIVISGVNGAIQLSTFIPISGGETIEIWQ